MTFLDRLAGPLLWIIIFLVIALTGCAAYRPPVPAYRAGAEEAAAFRGAKVTVGTVTGGPTSVTCRALTLDLPEPPAAYLRHALTDTLVRADRAGGAAVSFEVARLEVDSVAGRWTAAVRVLGPTPFVVSKVVTFDGGTFDGRGACDRAAQAFPELVRALVIGIGLGLGG